MKQQKKIRIVRLTKDEKQWKIYQALAGFANNLDRLHDAAAVRKNKLKSAPVELTVMVF